MVSLHGNKHFFVEFWALRNVKEKFLQWNYKYIHETWSIFICKGKTKQQFTFYSQKWLSRCLSVLIWFFFSRFSPENFRFSVIVIILLLCRILNEMTLNYPENDPNEIEKVRKKPLNLDESNPNFNIVFLLSSRLKVESELEIFFNEFQLLPLRSCSVLLTHQLH